MAENPQNQKKRPTAKSFFDPLVKVLGKIVKYKPYVGVHYKEVLDLVLKEVGINPKDSPWPLQGSGGKGQSYGLYRIVGYAFRNQRGNISSDWKYSGKREPYCVLVDGQRGMWGLTEAGTQYARELNHADRDDPTWVVVELSYAGEMKVEDGSLCRSIQRDLGVDEEHQVFIPATRYARKGRSTTLHLMEGYAFVESGLEEFRYFALEKTAYVNKIMSVNKGKYGLRGLSVIPDVRIRQMRQQLRELSASNIREGDYVQVLEGLYNTLSGAVLEIDGNYAMVFISLRSIRVITRLPKVFLEVCDEE